MILNEFEKEECSQMKSDKNSCLEATMEVDPGGTREEPILFLNIKNVGDDTIKVDRDLVFLLNINIIGRNGISLELEEAASISVPDRMDLKERFVLLKPNNSIQRKIELKKSFKYFVYGIGTSETNLIITAYEALFRLPAKSYPERIDIIYGPLYGFREGFAQYTGIESTTLGLFEGPLKTSIKCDQF